MGPATGQGGWPAVRWDNGTRDGERVVALAYHKLQARNRNRLRGDRKWGIGDGGVCMYKWIDSI